MFQTGCAIYDYSLYTQLAHLWAWLITSSHMTLWVNAVMHICTCLQVYISGRTPNFYSYNPFLLQKNTLLAKAFTLSTANMHDVFECLGIHAYASIMIGSNSSQWGMI